MTDMEKMIQIRIGSFARVHTRNCGKGYTCINCETFDLEIKKLKSKLISTKFIRHNAMS